MGHIRLPSQWPFNQSVMSYTCFIVIQPTIMGVGSNLRYCRSNCLPIVETWQIILQPRTGRSPFQASLGVLCLQYYQQSSLVGSSNFCHPFFQNFIALQKLLSTILSLSKVSPKYTTRQLNTSMDHIGIGTPHFFKEAKHQTDDIFWWLWSTFWIPLLQLTWSFQFDANDLCLKLMMLSSPVRIPLWSS